jgi:hypothetical protein
MGLERCTFVDLICTSNTVGARMEWRLSIFRYGCGQGWAVAMVSKCSQLTGRR